METKYVKTFEKFRIKESVEKFLKILKEEIKQKNKLKKIFIKYARNIPITPSEQQLVREELLDLLKILGMSTFFILPGSMLVIPFIIKLCNKYNVNIIPNSLKLESVSTDEVANLIEDGKKIFVKYIQDYSDHKEEDSYTPINVDSNGNIALDIDDEIFYTKVEWVDGIDEMMTIDVTPDSIKPTYSDANKELKTDWKNDLEFIQLLKDQGGVTNIKLKMKKEYDLNYNNCKTKSELYKALKSDNML